MKRCDKILTVIRSAGCYVEVDCRAAGVSMKVGLQVIEVIRVRDDSSLTPH